MNGMRKIMQISRKQDDVEENENDELDFDQEIEEVIEKANQEDVHSEECKKNSSDSQLLHEGANNNDFELTNTNLNNKLTKDVDNINKVELFKDDLDVVRKISSFDNIDSEIKGFPLNINQEILLNIPCVGDIDQLEDDLSDTLSRESKEANNDRSIYVKNLEYNVTPEDLEEHFKNCGDINRITILIDNYAFIEFATMEAKEKAHTFNDTLLKGKNIKVEDKRRNIPDYFGKKTKFFKRPTFTNEQYIRGSNSYFGPLKGKYIPTRNFQPY